MYHLASKNKFGIVKCHETQYPFEKAELIIFNTSTIQSCIDYQHKLSWCWYTNVWISVNQKMVLTMRNKPKATLKLLIMLVWLITCNYVVRNKAMKVSLNSVVFNYHEIICKQIAIMIFFNAFSFTLLIVSNVRRKLRWISRFYCLPWFLTIKLIIEPDASAIV